MKNFNLKISFSLGFSPETYINVFKSIDMFSDSFDFRFIGTKDDDPIFQISTNHLPDIYLAGLTGANIETQINEFKRFRRFL